TNPVPDTGNATTVTRANGLTVTWTGGSPIQFIQLDGFAATDNTFTAGASFTCIAPSAPGSFTIPAHVLAAMPATNFASLSFQPNVTPGTLPASLGLNLSGVFFNSETVAGLILK